MRLRLMKLRRRPGHGRGRRLLRIKLRRLGRHALQRLALIGMARRSGSVTGLRRSIGRRIGLSRMVGCRVVGVRRRCRLRELRLILRRA